VPGKPPFIESSFDLEVNNARLSPRSKKFQKKVDRIKNWPHSVPSEQPDSKQFISRSVKQEEPETMEGYRKIERTSVPDQIFEEIKNLAASCEV